ncbi:MAG: methylated-DNA--[protein]-cysteine S-methyltransferase [Proteobacteria bacterium]|nr:methylated-DNA--[protein]-cysteine S-methyltransferase [Pseudomonadota bacterium]
MTPTWIETPLGTCQLAATDEALVWAKLADAPEKHLEDRPSRAARHHLEAATEALREYFDGARRQFDDLELAPSGTPFQVAVWNALREIPHGETESYGGLARRLGRPGAARAVGMANHHNPIWIIIPCHRVIGADGSLTGYGGGLPVKEWLLAHEGARPASLFR